MTLEKLIDNLNLQLALHDCFEEQNVPIEEGLREEIKEEIEYLYQLEAISNIIHEYNMDYFAKRSKEEYFDKILEIYKLWEDDND